MPTGSNLNARQEAFCRGLAEGKPASRSYVEAGYNARGNAAEVNAARLLRKAQVANRLREMQAKHARRVEKTVADVIADLDRLRDQAFATGQISAGVAAVMGAAKILGMITDKSQLEQVQHKPSPIPTTRIELSVEEWREQFDPAYKATSTN